MVAPPGANTGEESSKQDNTETDAAPGPSGVAVMVEQRARKPACPPPGLGYLCAFSPVAKAGRADSAHGGWMEKRRGAIGITPGEQ